MLDMVYMPRLHAHYTTIKWILVLCRVIYFYSFLTLEEYVYMVRLKIQECKEEKGKNEVKNNSSVFISP